MCSAPPAKRQKSESASSPYTEYDQCSSEMPNTAPVMSIYKLKFEPENSEPTEYIRSLINKHNKKEIELALKRKNKVLAKLNRESITTKEYHLVESDKIVKLNAENEHTGFQMVTYTQTIAFLPKFTRCYLDDEDERESHVNAIIFYFNSEKVFAVTKRNSWHVVRSAVSHKCKFPQKIAARLLSEEGSKSYSEIQIVGDNRAATYVRKNPKPTDSLEPVIYTYFIASLRPDASLRGLDIFDGDKRMKKNNINVNIGLGYVRIEKEFTPTEWFRIIAHLSLIDEGIATKTTGNQDEKPTEAFLQYLQQVVDATRDELNKELYRILFNVYHKNDLSEFQFELSHSFSKDFYLSSKYKLSYGNEVFFFNHRPSLKEVLESIDTLPNAFKYFNQNRTIQKNELKPIEKFERIINKLKFGFLLDNRKDANDFHEENLINFIEGNAFYEGRLHWRVLNKWCYLYDDYYKIVHRQYLRCLQKDLLPTNKPAQLKVPWEKGEEEHDFAKKYYMNEKLPGYILGDRVKPDPHKVEIFDLLFIDPCESHKNRVFLYHIKKGFDGETRVASQQLLTSLETILRSSSSMRGDYVEDWYDALLQKYYPNEPRPAVLCSLTQFKIALNDATMVLALRADLDFCEPPSSKTFFPESGKIQKSLHLEKLLKEKVTIDDLEKNLRRKSAFKRLESAFPTAASSDVKQRIQDIAKQILEYLKELDYVDGQNEATSKLIYSTETAFKSDFKQYMNANSAATVYSRLLPEYQTRFKSLIAKLQLLRTKKEVEGNGRIFKICEIFGKEKN